MRDDPTSELPEGYADGSRLLRYRGVDDRLQSLQIRGDGLLAELSTIATGLRGHFDAWTVEDAVSFILSGAAPPFAKVRARTRASHLYPAASRITLTSTPVADRRRSAYYGRLRVRYGAPRDRPMSAKNLALAVFVECHWHPGVGWAKLLAAWNEAHPEGDELHWGQTSRQFKVDCQRAWQTLTGALWPVAPLRRSVAKSRSHARTRSVARPRLNSTA